MEARRDYLFDNLKVILIFLVIVGHFYGYYGFNVPLFAPIYNLIYFFHMPLFLFVNGYFSKRLDKPIMSHIKTLLIPFVTFEIIWFVINLVIFKKMTYPFILPYPYMWYLLVLFIYRISLKYLVRIRFILAISITVGVLCGVLNLPNYFVINRILGFLPFFLMGYYTDGKMISKIKNIPKIFSIAILLVGLTLGYFYLYSGIADNFLYYTNGFINAEVSNGVGIIARIALYTVSVVTSVAVINLTTSKETVLSRIGARTMVIYLVHIFVRQAMLMVIPGWSHNVFANLIILASPFVIMIILSFEIWTKAYGYIFDAKNYLTISKVDGQ